MGSLLADLVPFAIGLAVTPTAIATVILLLGSRRPVPNATAFTAPFALLYALLAGLAVVAAGAAPEPLFDDHDKAVASVGVGALLLVAGLVSLVRGRRHRGEAAEPGLLGHLRNAAPPLAFAVGLALALLNPNVAILFGGLAVITAADVGNGARVVGAAFLVCAAVSLMVTPILWRVLAPERAGRGLAAVSAWLGRHEHAVNLGVLLGFGTLFALRGLADL